MLISISGKKRAGKDEVANVLVKNHKYVKVALADGLRELCSKVFDMPLQEFTNDNTKERQFSHPIILDEEHLGFMLSVIENDWQIPVSKESKDKMLTKVGSQFIHPRHLLQIVGTEVIRDCISDNFWIDALEKKIENLADVVISDVRYSNERAWAKSRGALMCFVNRPNNPAKSDGHKSENDLGNESDYQIVMNNDDSLSRFQIEVGSFFNNYLSRGIK